MKAIHLLFTCEHAVNTVPDNYSHLFQDHQALLDSHRGIDLGALAIAKQMQRYFNAPLFSAPASRLLIDCNRSLHHPRCFSEITSILNAQDKKHIIDTYYLPYRQQIEHFIAQHLGAEDIVLHLSVHSFTPELNGLQRSADFALLYDPKRLGERDFAYKWKQRLSQTPFRVRMNYPYQGISDGYTTTLRRKFPDNYWGIELESNQKLANHPADQMKLIDCLTSTLNALITSGDPHGKVG